MKFKLTPLLLLLFINLTQQAFAMNNTEKQLSLEINSENLNYFIKINSTEIYSETNNSPVKQSIPINQWVLNGNNTFQVSINLKDEDNDHKLKTATTNKLIVSLVLSEQQNNIKTSYNISTFNLSPSTKEPNLIASQSTANIKLDKNNKYKSSDLGDIEIGHWSIINNNKWSSFSQNININIGLPEWAYITADDLGDDQNLSDDDYYSLLDMVYSNLESIWSLMKKKDIQAILKLTETRSRDFDGAYYLDSGSKQKEMEQSLRSAFNHKDLFLDEIVDKNRANLWIEANGKTVRLDVQDVGGPMIFYSHKDEAFTRYYDFYFMKKDGKLIIVR